VFLATSAACHRVTESIEDLPPEAFFNTTTLYPVAKKTEDIVNKTVNAVNKTEVTVNKTEDRKEYPNHKIASDETAWKIKTAFVDTENKGDNVTESPKANKTNDGKEFKPSQHLGTFFEAEPTRPTFDDFRPLKKPPNGYFR
jgi:hypothetical protein